ncbi:MAG TPA: response regulator, partial [Stellaceae bacterium]|nr:response regulator [Stellaceae bacterium]
MSPQSQPEAGASPTFSPSTNKIPARVRVLLIDDDDEFRESLSLNLMDEGFAVTTFASGPSALEHLAAGESVDVILLDWRMPGMNGLEVLRELRQRGVMTPVIFLT